MLEIIYSDIKEDRKKELVKIMIENKLEFSECYNNDQDHFIDDQLSQHCELTGTPVPYVAEQGPTYSSGGQPAEGGYFEDITITLNDIDITDFLTDKAIEGFNDYLIEQY